MKPTKHPGHDMPADVPMFLPLLALPSLEMLESRLLLSGTPPTFITPLADSYALSSSDVGKAITLGIDASDANNDPLTITATSNDPHLVVSTRSGQQTYAQLNFVDGNGNAVGTVLVQLFGDVANLAVNRFENLATKAVVNGAFATPDATHTAFYTNVLVHRVIPNFMIQTGDAVNGNGTGGSGLSATATGGEAAKFNDQIDPHLSFLGQGVLAMANSGANTNDSQFFITTYPYISGDGKYTIFGQVIAGQDVVNTISEERGSTTSGSSDGSTLPYDKIKLASVNILSDQTQNPSIAQDGTVTMYATPGFTGHATVTITLKDPEGNTTTKQISVDQLQFAAKMPNTWGDRPTVSGVPSAPVNTLPGQSGDFRISLSDSTLPSGTLDLTATTSVPGVTVSVVASSTTSATTNPATHYVIYYSLASNYSGPSVIPIVISTREHGLAAYGDVPAKVYTAYLTTFGNRPVISGIADNEVDQVAPGGTITKTVTITDDSSSASNLTVTVANTSTTGGVTTNILPSANASTPNAWDITITVPATYMSPAVPYLNGFDVTVSAVENTTGSNVTLTPTTKTFHVSTLGAGPTIGGIDDQVVMAPGEKRDITLAITDPGNTANLPLTVTATSNINGSGTGQQVVTLNTTTVNNAPVYTLHIDLTQRLPSNFTGVFKVTLSAVEQVASSSDTTTKDAAKPTTRDIYVLVQNPGDPALPDQVVSKNDAKVAVVAGGRLYVGTSSGIEIYDLSSDPSKPTFLGKYDTPNEVHQIIVQGNTAYVGVYGSAYGTYVMSAGEVMALDVTDPTNITQLYDAKTDSLVTDMALEGTKLYVADWTSGLDIYDVSNPAAITEAGWFLKDAAGHSLSQAAAVVVNGNYAYVADSGSPGGRLVVLDISNPQHVSFVRELSTQHISYVGRVRTITQGQPSGLSMDGNKLYLSDNVTGLFIYSLSHPENPTQVGWAGWKGSAIRAEGPLAVLAYGGYHILLNVSDPAKIKNMYAMYAPGYSGPAAFSGDYTYLPSQSEGVGVIDSAPLAASVMVDRVQKFTDDTGHSVTVEMTGSGAARVQKDSHGDITQINVSGSDATTVVTLIGTPGASIGNLYVGGPLAALLMPQVKLTGNLDIEGQPTRVVLGDVMHGDPTAEQSIQFNANGAITAKNPFTFTAGQLTDVQISSDFPISSFTAVDWLDDRSGGAADVDKLSAPSVGALRMTGRPGVTGNFQADVSLNPNGDATAGTVLGSAVIAGNVSSDAWMLKGSATQVQFNSAAGWTMAADGRISVLRSLHDLGGSVTASSYSQILVPGALTAPVTATGQTSGVSIASLVAGNADGAVVSVPGGITRLNVGQWTTGGLTAGWVGGLIARGGVGLTGNMGATVDVVGNLASAVVVGSLSGQWTSGTIGSLNVTHDLNSATLTLQKPASSTQMDLASLNVGGWIRHSRVLSAGRVGTVIAGGMDTSDLYAGYIGSPTAVTGLPTPAQFGNTTLFDHLGGIQLVQVRGIRSGAGYANSFIASNIAGWNIGSANLAYAALDTSAQAVSFGTTAHSLGTYTYHDATPAHTVNWTSRSGGTPRAVDNLIVQIV